MNETGVGTLKNVDRTADGGWSCCCCCCFLFFFSGECNQPEYSVSD